MEDCGLVGDVGASGGVMNGTFITLFVMKVPFITLADAPMA
jgi:hypothetical protein